MQGIVDYTNPDTTAIRSGSIEERVAFAQLDEWLLEETEFPTLTPFPLDLLTEEEPKAPKNFGLVVIKAGTESNYKPHANDREVIPVKKNLKKRLY